MIFAKRVYRIAGIYGLIVLLPQYFLEAKNGRDYPPAITHPEYYYGFVGIAVAWQLAFLIISTDPVRYRPLMIAAMLEKATFFAALVILFTLGRAHLMMLGAASLDMMFGLLFAAAYAKTAASPVAVRL